MVFYSAKFVGRELISLTHTKKREVIKVMRQRRYPSGKSDLIYL
jgi:hypothetical protein